MTLHSHENGSARQFHDTPPGREPLPLHRLGSDVVALILVGFVYFTLAHLGLRLASINPSATPIWPPTGFAIAAVFLWGYRITPAIFIGSFLVNQLTAGSIFTSLAIAGGNTLEAVIAGYLVERWAKGEQVFDAPTGIVKFALISLAATVVSATIGVSSLTLAGYAEMSSFFSVWLTWWVGDLAGALVVTPVVVLWAKSEPASLKPPQITRTALTYLAAGVVGVTAFSPVWPQTGLRDALGFLAVPPLLWASLRQGPRDTASVALIISAFAVWGTMMHGGPFAKPSLNDSFILLLTFMASTAVLSLALSTDVRVRQRAVNHQRQLALETRSASHAVNGRLFDVPVEKLIDYLRCALAVVALFACLIVPPENELIHWILAWYLFYSLIVLVIARLWPTEPLWPLGTHLIDLGTAALLMHYTMGSASPCFIFFTFTLIAGVLRWDWRGAIWTTLGLLCLFIAADAPPFGVGQLSRTILHSTYILVLGLILTYFGGLRAHNRQRWAKLAAWPTAEISIRPKPPLEKLLAHAADVMNAPRILVVWEALLEPQRHFSLWNEGHLECVIEAAEEPIERLLAPSLADAVFMSHSIQSSIVWTPSGMKLCRAPISAQLINKYKIQNLVSAPFNHAGCRGRVYALDCARRIESHLPLIEIVANRIGLELEHYFLRIQIEAAAADQARATLAHDLHDGILQSLTAAALQLQVCNKSPKAELRHHLNSIQELLTTEQKRVRNFVDGWRHKGCSESFSLTDGCERVLAELSKYWHCEIPLRVVPADAHLPSAFAEHIWLILAEAVANAAKHGGASRVLVDFEQTAETLAICVSDNGSGFRGSEGTYTDQALVAEQIGPRFLCDRVRGLGGHLTLSTSPAGSRLQIQLPLQRHG